jgi:hypothetical protein
VATRAVVVHFDTYVKVENWHAPHQSKKVGHHFLAIVSGSIRVLVFWDRHKEERR